MITQRYITMMISSLTILLLIAIVSGCTWSKPHIQHNLAVADRFDNYQIYPDFSYYTSGSLDDPRAVVALKPGFGLESEDWQPVEMTPEKLERWITALNDDFYAQFNTFSNGANVVGQNGEIVGHYYSVWQFPMVRMSGEKTITMAKPRNDYRIFNTYKEFFVDGVRDGH